MNLKNPHRSIFEEKSTPFHQRLLFVGMILFDHCRIFPPRVRIIPLFDRTKYSQPEIVYCNSGSSDVMYFYNIWQFLWHWTSQLPHHISLARSAIQEHSPEHHPFHASKRCGFFLFCSTILSNKWKPQRIAKLQLDFSHMKSPLQVDPALLALLVSVPLLLPAVENTFQIVFPAKMWTVQEQT